MSVRDLLVLGSASAVPTRTRNHNGYLLRWDGHGLMFDPGEGTQRQMIHAGVGAHDITWICVTHFHGDHCLGVPGIVQRLSRDGVLQVDAAFPASGAEYWDRLRHATIFHDSLGIREQQVTGSMMELDTGRAPFALIARRLDHPVEAYGYQLVEPDGVTMVPAELAARGVRGPLIGQLQEHGRVTAPGGATVTLEECSVHRPGQRAAFIMDTRLCDAVYELADRADLLILESTFLDEDAALARDYGHLTVGQAAKVAAEVGAGRLVLTHFSERYRPEDEQRFADQAAAVFGGDIFVARDLDRIPVPPRRSKEPTAPKDS